MNFISPAIRNTAISLYSNIIAAYVIMVLFANVPLFAAYINKEIAAPDFYYVAIGLFSVLLITNIRSGYAFLKTPIAKWIIFVTIVYAVNLYLLQAGDFSIVDDEWIDLVNRLQRQVMFFLLVFTIYHIDSAYFYRYLKPVSFLIPLVIIIDFYFIGLLDPFGAKFSGRAQGTYLNANLAAEACVILGVLMHRTYRGMWLVAFFAVTGLAIVLTFSRSGIAAWLILGMYLVISKRLPRYLLLVPIAVGLFYSTIILSIEGYLLNIFSDGTGDESRVANMIDRLAFFSDIGVEQAQEDDSGASRMELAIGTLEAVIKNPIFGYVEGPLVAFGDEAHNLILELWYTFGLAGLVMYLWMFWMLLKPHSRKTIDPLNPFFVIFLFMTFFDHSQFVVMIWIIFYAFALKEGGIVIAPRRLKSKRVELTRQSGRRRRKKMSW